MGAKAAENYIRCVVETCLKCHGQGYYLKRQLTDNYMRYESTPPEHLYQYGCEFCHTLRKILGMKLFYNDKPAPGYSMYGGVVKR